MSHTHDEMQQVLARAAQLEQATSLSPADIDSLLQAADEVGISRGAVERALRERYATPRFAPVVGSLVFAPSADRNSYVAEVVSETEHGYTVRFLRGGEHVVTAEELRPCSFLPGQRVYVKWPGWGSWPGTIASYDASQQLLAVSDGWAETKNFHIADVWLGPVKPKHGPNRSRLRAALLGAAAAGAAIGSVLTAMLIG
jgi:hypothetical protein